MRLALFSLWLVATPLLAGEMIGLGNDMDGDCFQASSGTIRKSYRASHQISEHFPGSLTETDDGRFCFKEDHLATNLNSLKAAAIRKNEVIKPVVTKATEEKVNFFNDREGKSYYASNGTTRSITRALQAFNENEILESYQATLSESVEGKLCSYDLNVKLKEKLLKLNPKDDDQYEGVVHFLRSQDQIDDVVAKLLLDAHKTKTTYLPAKRPDALYLPSNKVMVKDILAIMATFETKFAKGTCFDDAYKNFYAEILKKYKDIKTNQIEAILVEALNKKVITQEVYIALEQARVNEMETQPLTLQGYYKKIKSLRIQYPLRDVKERSNWITEKIDKPKMSRRQKLLSYYTDLQIILMGNVVKRLRVRLESNQAEILLHTKEGVETITLDPMDRFRLAIALLRKEMSELAMNTYFNGRAPDYFDLMVSSYEVGIIPASELDEIANLQDIWNPKKSFWDKAGVWIKLVASTASLALPPPYGFIPALGIVIIEATVGKKDQTTDTSWSIIK